MKRCIACNVVIGHRKYYCYRCLTELTEKAGENNDDWIHSYIDFNLDEIFVLPEGGSIATGDPVSYRIEFGFTNSNSDLSSISLSTFIKQSSIDLE